MATNLTGFHGRDSTESQITESFDSYVAVSDLVTFGTYNQLQIKISGSGSGFDIPGDGICDQLSPSYLDCGIIRPTIRLPKTYTVSAIVGEIDYGLEKLDGLENDPAYSEGPLNENGVYLLTITDSLPYVPHENDWWHQHRKVVLDVDNNIWGWGMPNPVFMVYFDTINDLHCYKEDETWTTDWLNCLHYLPLSSGSFFYKAQIQKTNSHFIMSMFTEAGSLIISGAQLISNVLNGAQTPEWFALGDPHENYYQGSSKIKEITMPVEFGYATPFIGAYTP